MTAVPPRSPRRRRGVGRGASARLWHSRRVVLPVVVVNAAVQAALLLAGSPPSRTIVLGVSALASYVWLVGSFGLVAAAALQAGEGPSDAAAALRTLWERAWALLGWSVGLTAVVTVGIALAVLPGLLVLAATPYLLLAVLDGQRRPLTTNLRTIGARRGRWLLTAAVSGVAGCGLWVLAVLDGMFIGRAPGAAVGWLVLGLAAGWCCCAWADTYRLVHAPPATDGPGHAVTA